MPTNDATIVWSMVMMFVSLTPAARILADRLFTTKLLNLARAPRKLLNVVSVSLRRLSAGASVFADTGSCGGKGFL